MTSAPPRIFDADARAHAYARRRRGPVGDFHRRQTEDLLERFDLVTRPKAAVLLTNPPDPLLRAGLEARGCRVEERHAADGFREDQPSLPDGRWQAIISPDGLDAVDDLPGALTLLRRALAPDGLLLASFPGGGSFARAREASLAADLTTGGTAVARWHPLVDVRSLGDLAARAGLTLPVAEVDGVDLRYRSLARVFTDLRAHGWRSVLAGERPSLSREWLRAAEQAYAAYAVDGRVAERLNLVTLTAWSVGPDQPRPAARGSGRASLARTLPDRSATGGASTNS